MKLLPTILMLTILSSCKKDSGYKFVLIEGRKQHVLDLGHGKPSVIFITGLGNGLEVFDSVQTEIAKVTRTVSYDRAGLGKSEIIDTVRTVDRMAKELDQLISAMEISDPVVLVAHSLGGQIARYYLHMHPDKVSGLVLIDPSDETFFETILSRLNPSDRAKQDSIFYSIPSGLPVEVRNEIKYLRKTDSLIRAIDFKSEIPINLLVAVKLTDIDRKGYGMTDEYMRTKVDCFERLRSKMPQIQIKVTNKSGHYIQLEQPDLVIGAIQDVLNEVKANRR